MNDVEHNRGLRELEQELSDLWKDRYGRGPIPNETKRKTVEIYNKMLKFNGNDFMCLSLVAGITRCKIPTIRKWVVGKISWKLNYKRKSPAKKPAPEPIVRLATEQRPTTDRVELYINGCRVFISGNNAKAVARELLK